MKRFLLYILLGLASTLSMAQASIQSYGVVSIKTTPSSADVYIDKVLAGKTPFEQNLHAGNHEILIRKAGFDDINYHITVEENQTYNFAPILFPNATSVTLQVDGDFDIYVDGEHVGTKEWNGVVKAGQHTFEARKEGHRTTTLTETTIEKTHHTFILDTPTPVYGTVKITSRPSRADVEIDGNFVGRTPLYQEVLIGKHSIGFSKEGFDAEARYRTISSEEEQTVSAVLDKRRDYSGFESVVDIAFKVGCGGAPSTVLGTRYIAGYRFNAYLYLGAGAGLDINSFVGTDERYTDRWWDYDREYLRTTRLSVPIFIYSQLNWAKTRCSPFIALAAGGNFGGKQTLQLDLVDAQYHNIGAFINPQLGIGGYSRCGLGYQFSIGFQCFGAAKCTEYTGYNAWIDRAPAYGVDFHISFTF